MRKNVNLLMWVLTVITTLFSGVAFAGANDLPLDYSDPTDRVEPQIGHEGPAVNTSTVTPVNPGSDHDPVNAATNDRFGPGAEKAGQDLTGSQMSSTQITKGGLLEDEWDKEVVKFRPYQNPFFVLSRVLAKTQKVSNWIVNHMRVGGETLEVVVTQTINDDVETVAQYSDTITLSSSNVSGSLRPFYKGSTVFALGVPGYKAGSQTETEGELMLFVVDSDKTSVTLMAVNGRARSSGITGDELDYVQCPKIPAGTILSCGATAGGESQMMIAPENFQPRPFQVYLQKKLFNIVITEDFDKAKKKTPLSFNDVKGDALAKFNMRNERSYFRSKKARFNVQNADGSVEFCYTSDGVLSQITNSYAIDSDYTLMDLIAISKLQFTEFSENNRAFVFCGKNAMERLLNINPGDNRRIVFNDVNKWNLDFKEFKTTFGTLYFIWAQTLDMLHMENCMLVLDMDGAVRYVKDGVREKTIDMSQGAGEVRHAKRFMHEESDCIALRGYNSIIVGPEDVIFSLPETKSMSRIISSGSLPANAATGTLVALTEDYTIDDTTYTAGVVYEKGAESWSEYTGLTLGV